MVEQPCDHPNPHADCLPLAGAAAFPGLRHLPTLTSNSTLNVYSRLGTGYLQTDGCPRLLRPRTSTIYPLSLQLIGVRSRRGCAASSLARPTVAIFTWTPFEMHASLTSLGLASRLVVTDLTPNFAFSPVLDYHPRYRESC